MATHAGKISDIEQDRKALIDDLNEDQEPNWPEQYKPGSLGCHELLDRTTVAADHIEQHVLAHPACVQNPHWYALADKAVAALRELYQQVGAKHLDEKDVGTACDVQAGEPR